MSLCAMVTVVNKQKKIENYPFSIIKIKELICSCVPGATPPTEMARHFENPYPDYNAQVASKYINNGEIKEDSIIVEKLEDHWNSVAEKLKSITERDSSVYTGAAGVALLRLKKFGETPENLESARKLLQLSHLKNRRQTFLCGDCGPLAIGAVIEYKLGKTESFQKIVRTISNMQDDVLNTKSDLPNEYMYGRAGYLYALLYVNQYTGEEVYDETLIRKVITTILYLGKIEAKEGNFKCPLMYQWHQSFYLGAAHGLTGILYLLLQAKKYLNEEELENLIKPTIDYLHSVRFPSGNYPSSLGRDTDKYVQWCHGAPGFVFLFSIAYTTFSDPKYLQWALDAGDIVWKRGLLKKGYSLCHGVSGNGYCFLELFQVTQDEKHLYRAARFAEWCIEYNENHEEYPPDRPLSLFEGICGPMYFLLDIMNPMQAKFPGFSL